MSTTIVLVHGRSQQHKNAAHLETSFDQLAAEFEAWLAKQGLMDRNERIRPGRPDSTSTPCFCAVSTRIFRRAVLIVRPLGFWKLGRA